MRFCLMVEGQEGVSWDEWVALARTCEECGLEGLFRSDHYQSVFGVPGRAALDAWGTVAALGAVTERIRLGTLVSPATFRRPSVLARLVATADHVSGGRVELGLGAGWNAVEHEAYGFPFPELGERMEILEEQLEIVHRQWTEDEFSFEGRHYRLQQSRAEPKPVQKPHPPLILGGHAGPRAARLAARWANEYNTAFATPDDCRAGKDRIDEACAEAGRDPIPFSLMIPCVVGRDEDEARDRLRRRLERIGDTDHPITLGGDEDKLIGTGEQVLDRLGQYRDAGVERVFLQHLDHADLDMVRLIGAEIVPAFQ